MDREAVRRRRSDATPSWPALHDVLRDRSRNVLFNHLGLGEDEMKMVLRPDCADLPYFLRAYFAFKMGLPFGFSKCSRGGAGKPPRCHGWESIQNPEQKSPAIAQRQQGIGASEIGVGGQASRNDGTGQAIGRVKQPGLAAAFGQYLRTVADGVHSGTGRTPASDNNTDYYPVPLQQDTLRPGTVYADPYGHIMMLTRRVPQSDGAAGVFLAVDGQPDGTVARKRFWRGNFLFAQDPALGSPGFKRFRPIVRDTNGALRRLTNDEIAKNPQYGDFSLDQSRARRRRLLRSNGRRDVAVAARSGARDAGGDHVARRASEGRASRRSRTGESSRTAGAARRPCRTARRSSRRSARGRISPRRRAICAS